MENNAIPAPVFVSHGDTMDYTYYLPDGREQSCTLEYGIGDDLYGVRAPKFTLKSENIGGPDYRGRKSYNISPLDLRPNSKYFALETVLDLPIPEEMKQELLARLSAYQKALLKRDHEIASLLVEFAGADAALAGDRRYDSFWLWHPLEKLVRFLQSELSEAEIADQKAQTRIQLLEAIAELKQNFIDQQLKKLTPRHLHRWYPGGDSAGGFLAWGEKLEEVIAADNATVASLGHSHQEIGQKLEEIFAHGKKSPFRLEETVYRGYQHCPFADCSYPYKKAYGPSDMDFVLTNPASGESISGPGLIAHLIAQHQFFKGPRSPYRVDPAQLVKVLFG